MYNWRLIVNTLLIFAVAFSFFAAPTFFIDMINNFSQELSGEVLAKTATITTGRSVTADDAVVHLGNSFWEMTVVKQWQLIQFGDTEIGRREMDDFLSKNPDSKSRKELANDMAKTNDLFKPTGTITRSVMVLFVGIIVLVLNIFVGIIAAITAALQFAAIISAIVMILAFAISLLPNMGFNVALHSLYNTFGFLLGKIGMAVLLSMYFAISSVIYGLSSEYGWMMVTLLQVILIATIILFRKKIFGFLQSVTSGQQAAINNIH
ncbi:hypothetical protein L21TH_2347 [Caldisalinibacter kiritimatiensis]|uniref:Uncharacterized protein n=2 Tax=Caldisalinibacter kiritimatiensis TaxID=1304284 RepID=R1AR56_9FIRM|nr:hypothetical protein [Caldisalinibacter kiritimatiensis]EOC99637.1 hypothetical protein L21TH_2347 [Caldisalinibacter kiritimatiensis]